MKIVHSVAQPELHRAILLGFILCRDLALTGRSFSCQCLTPRVVCGQGSISGEKSMGCVVWGCTGPRDLSHWFSRSLSGEGAEEPSCLVCQKSIWRALEAPSANLHPILWWPYVQAEGHFVSETDPLEHSNPGSSPKQQLETVLV